MPKIKKYNLDPFPLIKQLKDHGRRVEKVVVAPLNDNEVKLRVKKYWLAFYLYLRKAKATEAFLYRIRMTPTIFYSVSLSFQVKATSYYCLFLFNSQLTHLFLYCRRI